MEKSKEYLSSKSRETAVEIIEDAKNVEFKQTKFSQ